MNTQSTFYDSTITNKAVVCQVCRLIYLQNGTHYVFAVQGKFVLCVLDQFFGLVNRLY